MDDLLLAVLAGLIVTVLAWLAKLLHGKQAKRRVERKVEDAVANDSALDALRSAVVALDEALHPIPTPAPGAGDDVANQAVRTWKNGLSIAISDLQFAVHNAPHRPITDPALLARIEAMEQMADEAVRELGQQPGLSGDRGNEAVYVGTDWAYKLLTEARYVLKRYETDLREQLQRDQQRSTS